jgi:hypothetical protein
MAEAARAVGLRRHTCTEPLTPRAGPLTSCCHRSGMRLAAKHFLRLALWRTGQIRPRVINVDGHAACLPALAELKASGELSRRCPCRPSPYSNHVLEQDHRFVRKRVAASLWFPLRRGRVATIAGLRGGEHDPEGPGQVVGKGRCSRASTLHRTDLRDRCIGSPSNLMRRSVRQYPFAADPFGDVRDWQQSFAP